jgi:aryl-alcohol dehydrogenase-like predicted oxidoreductase
VKQVQFGNTRLSVTPIGLGLAALGRPGYINLGHAEDLEEDYAIGAMEERTHIVLDTAWAAGVRYFDAARSYGRAEAFLGSWLASRSIPSSEVVVGSKWGYTYTADWQVEAEKHEVKDHSLPVLVRQIQESRNTLGGYLNIYQVHSATEESGILENRDVLKALAELRNQGLTVGLSLSGPNQAETLRAAMKIEFDGEPLFRSVQATWNLLSKEAGPALADAHQAGMGVIIKEALANGRLTDRNDEPAFLFKKNLLVRVANEINCTIDALAIGAAVAQQWSDVVLSGAATVDHLQSNLKALDIAWNTELEDRLAPLVESPQEYWGIRSGLDWN